MSESKRPKASTQNPRARREKKQPPGSSNQAPVVHASSDSDKLVVSDDAIVTETHICSYDENLLERSRIQWQFGKWQSLCQIDRDTLQHHPDRAKLALLTTAGHLQCGSMDQARRYVRLARDWGCDKQLVSRILIAGVHNSLGRAAALAGKQPKALDHFERAVAIGTPGNDARQLSRARSNEQLLQLGFSDSNAALDMGEVAALTDSKKLPSSPPLEALQPQNTELATKVKEQGVELARLRHSLSGTLKGVDAILERAVNQVPDNAELVSSHAELAMSREDYRDAVRRWQDVAVILSQNTPQEIYDRLSEAQARMIGGFGGTQEENAVWGERHKHNILAFVHKELKPELYFEIGVDAGVSLALAECRSIGIDPMPNLKLCKPLPELPPKATIVQVSSDKFFRRFAQEQLATPPDLVFIDGMHLFEFALRDFMNVELYSSPTTLVVIDDIYPCNFAQASRRRRTSSWAGDVWKLHAILRKFRPELPIISLDAGTTGLLLIAGLDADNRVLRDNYEKIVSQYIDISSPPESVIAREGAMPCGDEVITPFLSVVKKAKRDGASRETVVNNLWDVVRKTNQKPAKHSPVKRVEQ